VDTSASLAKVKKAAKEAETLKKELKDEKE